MSRRRDAAQIASRLTESTSGTSTSTSRYTGHGIVQPVQAPTGSCHSAATAASSRSSRTTATRSRATAPKAPGDPLAVLKDHLIWIGLFGAAALVLAALLRVLVRRG